MVRPLTKFCRKGHLYTRPPEVEANIDGALAQDLHALRERLRVIDRKSPDYLTSECLVHLMRDAIRRTDPDRQYAFLQALLTRCEANLNGTIRPTVPCAEQLREDVLGEFSLLLAKDAADEASDVLDYYECRFDRAFRALRIRVLRREETHINRVVPLPEGSNKPDQDTDSRLEEILRSRAAHEDGLRLEDLLNALPAKEREAVVLRYLLGYEIESKDPEEETVATRCGVTGRTIGTRLRQAKERLARMLQEDI